VSRLPLAALAGLFLVSLALRPQLLAIGPLLPFIRADLGLPAAVAGLLGTIPVLCMGLFAPAGPRLVARIGPRLAMAACLAALGGFGLLRAVAPNVPLILLATFGLGVAVGTAGAIPAIIVKLRASGVPALGTGAYAGGIVGGSALAAAVAVPLAGASGDWRSSLGILALAGLVPLAAWLVFVPPDRPEVSGADPAPALPWGSGTAWLLVAIFGLQSLLYYALVAWMPNAYVERGWDAGSAGSLVAIINGVGLTTTLGVPIVADRLGSRRAQLIAASVAALGGLLGVVLLPELGVLWAAGLGLALGAVFPLVLTLPVDVADAPGDVGATAALMLLGGYVLSATGPVLLGLARDATGNFAASLWMLVGLGVVLVGTCLLLSPRRLDRGVRREVAPVA
jgi:CP family cyanate transporter-like MFS transporter